MISAMSSMMLSFLLLATTLTCSLALRPSAASMRIPRHSARLEATAYPPAACSASSQLIAAITAEDLAGYQKEGVPPWVVILSVSLVALTVAVPVIVRKRQVEKNTRRPSPDMFSELENVPDE